MASKRVTRSQRALLTVSLPEPVAAEREGTLPDSEQVPQVREREREAGGPAVPHNSLDLSAVDLSETRAEAAGDTPEVFQEEEAEVPPLSRVQNHLRSIRMLQQRQRIEIEQRIEDVVRQRQRIEQMVEDVVMLQQAFRMARRDVLELSPTRAQQLDSTIDLTDSPPPSSPEVSSTSLSLPGDGSLASLLWLLLSPFTMLWAILSSLMPNNQEPLSPCTGPLADLLCPVCMDSLAEAKKRGRGILSSSCGHVFCTSCLPRSLQTTGRCPTCRSRLGPRDYHNLYLD